MKQRPPTSPLFPYTTLFRSRNRRGRPQSSTENDVDYNRRRDGAILVLRDSRRQPLDPISRERQEGSEEHTSELQSLLQLVRRLLHHRLHSRDLALGHGFGDP